MSAETGDKLGDTSGGKNGLGESIETALEAEFRWLIESLDGVRDRFFVMKASRTEEGENPIAVYWYGDSSIWSRTKRKFVGVNLSVDGLPEIKAGSGTGYLEENTFSSDGSGMMLKKRRFFLIGGEVILADPIEENSGTVALGASYAVVNEVGSI